ncbi:ATP-dependent zinc metalloprotease FtsH [Gloeobacter violaceus]|uniref:ATP-dependent zinc metalloprotease FtsH n=1 Tax=Gloeobacter violaceus (strain ATCC 29082 / PCC 7421) TaxID=251221 RepID=Q7NGM7_GLOVI|nr:ATP-dependent zinc metalloprotease FtsH [Gloeobacter violaceus]BAC91082.1 cell division protein [Gloeobacter violaceus PCC 7421]
MGEQSGGERTNTPKSGRGWDYIAVLVLVLVAVNLLVLPAVLMSASGPSEPYSRFIEQLEQGKVARALVAGDRIEYELAGEKKRHRTVPLPTDPQLAGLLRRHKVEYTAAPSRGADWLPGVLGWLMLPLAVLGFWWLLGRGGAQGPQTLTMSRSRARIYAQGSTGVAFGDVAGVDEAKGELQEIVQFLKQPERYTRIGAKIPKGVLLVGPPGTGKTLLAKAVAGEAGVPFFSISGSEFVELFVGVGAARVRDLFEQAKQQAPCIIFIDELDAIGKSRVGSPMAGGNDEREQTLNQLLAEMDGFAPNTGVILLAATNRPESLDPALLRPGRFDRRVLVDRPDKTGRLAILQVHARPVKLAPDVDLVAMAGRTAGFAGADLANLINEAALLAARQGKAAVTMADLAEALERVVAGLEKRSRVLGDEERATVAHHESGHAIVARLVPCTGRVEKISIVPRGMAALGYTLQLPEEDRFLMSEPEMRGRLAVLMGGRAAEHIIFGELSTGAADDLQQATDLAQRMITLYGMGADLGPVAFEKPQSEFLGGTALRRPVSEAVAEQIDREVRAVLESAYAHALGLLRANGPLLEEMARLLLVQEVLEGPQLRALLERAVSLAQPRTALCAESAP